jgi:protein-L-isoaspartate(D-aspartate) O-methyltransferase
MRLGHGRAHRFSARVVALGLVLGLAALGSSQPACGESQHGRPAARAPDDRHRREGASHDPRAADTLGSELAAIDGPEQQHARRRMVQLQVQERGVRDERVLQAMRKVPRHAFVAKDLEPRAYEDYPLPIEAGQTISQPYIVALMSQLAEISPGEKVLEIGTGSGYQAAVLAALGARVYSIEIVEQLATSARERLRRLGIAVEVRHGDGYAGWAEAAPFDAILVTAAPPEIPAPLREQLAVGGRLVAPVGSGSQHLLVLTRTATGYEQRNVLPVRFVPMTGKAQER